MLIEKMQTLDLIIIFGCFISARLLLILLNFRIKIVLWKQQIS